MCQALSHTAERPAIAAKHIERLVALFHHRWAVAVLAELHRGRGGKYVTLLNRLGISRGALSQTLNHLIDLGLAMRNPGYGHPLRPEYILTPAGKRAGPAFEKLVAALARQDLEPTALRKWAGAALLAIGGGAGRFGEIRAALAGVTDRALTLVLKDLSAADLVERRIVDDFPPTPIYAMTAAGRRLAAALRAVAKCLPPLP